MITFITSYPHFYTVQSLRGEVLSPLVPRSRAISYDRFFAANELRRSTYVFTDLERLHPAELRLAETYYRWLRTLPGFRVLNDPARVRTRYGLLRALAEAGLNDFDAYCAEAFPRPRRFPVFVRVASDHAGPIGDLIHNQAALDQRLGALEAEGIPLAGLLVVEFCGERNGHGHFEKLSFLKIGDKITLSALLIGEDWNVKHAAPSIRLVTPEIERDQIAAMREDRHAEEMREAFDIAGIDYGRADVGFGDGRFQVYEINTNPSIKASVEYRSDDFRDARRIFHARLGSMLHEVDVPESPHAIAVDLGPLDGPSEARRDIAKMVTGFKIARQRSSTPP